MELSEEEKKAIAREVDANYTRKRRADKKERGWQPLWLEVHDEDRVAIKRYAKRLKDRRLNDVSANG